MKLQISAVQGLDIGQYIATFFVISVDSKSSNHTPHMGMVISLLRSFIKKLSNSSRVWDSVSLKDHSAISDKRKSILFRVIVCCFNSQMSEIPDFSLCILRVQNLSDHERVENAAGSFCPQRHLCCMSFNILALASLFVFYPQFRGRSHHLILEPYAICALFRVTFFFLLLLQRLCKTRCAWKVPTLLLPLWSLTLLSWHLTQDLIFDHNP